MSANPGTLRGTPGRQGGRGAIPFAANANASSPGPSGIPRPVHEGAPAGTAASEAGASSVSASRQKQTKRDEVRFPPRPHSAAKLPTKTPQS